MAGNSRGLDRELAGVRAQLDVQRGEARRLNAELAVIRRMPGCSSNWPTSGRSWAPKQALMQQLGSLSCKNPGAMRA